MKHPFLIYLILLFAIVTWCGLIILAPLVARAGYGDWATVLYTVFGRVCHQLDSHSLHIVGEKLGVCARCSAMYFGFLLGMLAYPVFRPIARPSIPARGWILLAAIPMGVDVVLAIAGIHSATDLTRVFTGGFFGVCIAFTIVPGFQLAVSSLISSSRRNHAC